MLIEPRQMRGLQRIVGRSPATVSERRQVVDLPPVPPPVITEYQRLSKTVGCCGAVTTADWAAAPVIADTPRWWPAGRVAGADRAPRVGRARC